MKQMTEAQPGKKLQLIMTEQDTEVINFLLRERGGTAASIMRGALRRDAYLLKQQQQGSKLRLEKPDGSCVELVFLEDV